MKNVILDKQILRKVSNALRSLTDSSYLSARVPWGPQVDVMGRNGSRLRWVVKDRKPTHDGLDVYFTFDNGKYAIIACSYYVNLDVEFSTVYAPLPIHVIFPLFRGVGEVFLASSNESLRRLFFPATSVIHVWACHPYTELLKFD